MPSVYKRSDTFADQGSYEAQKHYDVDIVLCIDGTKSMFPMINKVKENALSLSDDILRVAQQKKKRIDNLRIKILVFRDYLSDGAYFMEESDFFQMPEEKEDLRTVMQGIIASGGGDEPEDALEALAYAMSSDWQPPRSGTARRQIISVWTDASAHDLGFGKGSEYYDSDFLPGSFQALTDWWGDDKTEDSRMDYTSKRLALFAPETEPWLKLKRCWDHVFLTPSIAGQGMKESEYEEVIQLIVNTI